MESTLFIALTTNEEANLSGGARDFSGNNFAIGNTALALPINIAVGGGNGTAGSRNGNVLTAQSATANAGNIVRNRSN
ncbi:hypothetical protein [Nostoc sp.]|uniref:hypothetical protein n=1 Tax=Nostoc sp. TaxID=1180 RepID=UPI002FF75342